MTSDLKISLDDLAEAAYAEAPVSTVDIDKARADGRRRVLAARLAPIGGGVAVVAACALVVNGLGGTSPAKTGGPSSAAAGRHFTGTDPLTAVAKFGWLPDGYVATSTTTGGDYGSGVTARAKQPQSSTPTAPQMLALTSSTTEPQLRSFETKTEVSVKGSPKAYIVHTPGDGPEVPEEMRLRWQTASGSWFTLGGDYQMPGTELQPLLIKVADSVTPSGTAVPLPIHIDGLPQGVTLGEAMLNDPVEVGTDGFTVGLSYHSGTAGPGTGHYFSVSVAPTGQQEAATSQVGKAGIKLTPANPASNTCKDSEGLQICVQDDPKQPGPDPLASVGGAKGLLDRITSLGTDRANWTTHVVN